MALGELLIDFTENGKSEQNNSLFEANPGGAPCNVLAMLKKLNKECAFIGKVENDMFGRLLTDVVKQAGICTDGLVVDSYYNTTLAFVKTFDNGDRDFFVLSSSRCRYDVNCRRSIGSNDCRFENIPFWNAFHDK